MDITFRKPQTDFFNRLRSEVNDYFLKRNIKSTGGSRIWFKTIMIITALAGIYSWLVFFAPHSWWWSMSLFALQGVVIALVGFNIMHDGAHGSFSGSKGINRIMAYSLNLVGGNALFWMKKHNISHHTYTNIETGDDDINMEPFLRLHDHQQKRWFHRYQHIYAFGLYGMFYILWVYFLDFRRYFTRKISVNTTLPAMNLKEHFIF